VIDRSTVEMRVWERGVGETQACGSGACAVAVASRLHGHVDDSVRVRLPGGELMIEWDGEGVVYLEGPVAFVFESRWEGSE
jgi:diaminopimelate epimerase